MNTAKRNMYLRMVSASLVRRRSRMVVALLAIMIGATILSGLLTIYIDVPRQMGAQFRSYGANMLFTATEGSFSQAELAEGVAVILAGEGELVGVAPYHYETVRINDMAVMAAGTEMSGAQKTSPFWAVDGEWPAAEREAMLGKKVAETYGLKPGDTVTVTYTPEDESILLDNELTLTVTGILTTGGSEEEYIYLSLEELSELTDTRPVLDVAELSISADADTLSAYAERVSEVCPGISARLVKRVTQSETAVLGKLQALVLLVTVVVLALTMICVATTMTAVVTERRKEIGLRKALGASDASLIAEFAGEGLMLGIAGGILGALLGFGFAQAVSVSVFHSPISFRFALLPLTVLVSVLVTGLASMLPIRSATAIDPALVLKGE